MADPYIGEIRMFAGSYAPAGWALCDGSLMPISENETLFILIGTTYGGDGETTFALPDLQGRVPVHQSAAAPLGAQAGVEEVTLTVQQIPSHAHPLIASRAPGSTANPGGHVLASPPGITAMIPDAPSANLAPGAAGPAGGSQPHENRAPHLAVTYIISLYGTFPSET